MEKRTQVTNHFQADKKEWKHFYSIILFGSQISWQQLYENQISPITWSYKMLSTQKANLQNNKSSKLLDLEQQDNVNKK